MRPLDKGPTVTIVQQALLDAGQDVGPEGADGKFGPATGEAVKAFKTKHHLGSERFPDIGPGTMAKLDALCASPKPTPTPAPTKPGPAPPAKPRQRGGCSDEVSDTISTALGAAQSDLGIAISSLGERPLSQHAQDAAWLSLRATSPADLDAVLTKLRGTKDGLVGADIGCNEPGFFCDEGTNAFTNPVTGAIHVCRARWVNFDSSKRERTLIHEGTHAFAGTPGPVGERSHGDTCEESDVEGQSRSFRLHNADSLSCFVMLLTHSTNLAGQVRHSKGEDLRIVQQPKGDISLVAAASTTFRTEGFEHVGIQSTRWIFRDGQGRRYLLRADGGKAIISPDEGTIFRAGLFLGAKTRELLRDRGVTDAELVAVSTIPEVGQRVTRLSVHLVP